MDRSHVVENGPIRKEFQEEQLLALSIAKLPWYADIVNLLVSGVYLHKATGRQNKKLYFDSCLYVWDESYLFKQGADRVIQICVPECQAKQVFENCHITKWSST